jgi:hypothetical protein
MRLTPGKALIVIGAAACGWLVRGAGPGDAQSPAAPASPTLTSSSDPRSAVTVTGVQRMPSPQEASGSRNLFAYREEEIPRVEPAHTIPAAPAVAATISAAAPTPALPAESPLPPFAYRYIGRFGTPENTVAAFTRDGEVLTIRNGQRIDAQFILREIHLESVEVEAIGLGAHGRQRVALQATQ